MATAQQHEDAVRLFQQFIEQFLQIKFRGFQNGFGIKPDLILFDGPALDEPGNPLHGLRSTLGVPVGIMLLPQEAARAEVRRRWEASYIERRHDRRHVDPQVESRAAL